MKTSSSSLSSLCIAAITLLTSASASELWVSHDALTKDSYPTIQAALNDAQPGDTVRVGAGIYRERVQFKQDGTSEAPITLQGETGAIIDGSTAVVLDWELAPEIGLGVYRAPLDFFPFTVTANGQTITTLDEKRTSEPNPDPNFLGWEGIYWKDAFVNGVGSTGWHGVKALAMYRHQEKDLLIRFKDELDPNQLTMTVAPREPVVDINGTDHCIVRNLTLRNSAIGVRLQNSTGSIIESCVISPADYGVLLDENAQDSTIRFNRISLAPYAGADPWANGAWDNWKAMKIGGFYDRVGIQMKKTLGGHSIHNNYIHDHWDGIDDHGNPPWEKLEGEADANPNLSVHHNRLYNLNDDALETMGPSVEGQWHDNLIIRTRCGFRIKAPRTGPLYIYRNIFLDNKEDLRNWGQGEQFYPDAEVWVYHNTSTSDAAVSLNYHNLRKTLTTPNYHYINNLFWCNRWIRSNDQLALPNWQTAGNVFIRATSESPRPWDSERGRKSPEEADQTWQESLKQAMLAKREIDSTWVGSGPAGFVDPNNNNLALQENSPARNRGVALQAITDQQLPGYDTNIANPDAGALPFGQAMPKIPAMNKNNSKITEAQNVGRTIVVLVGDSTVTGKSKDKDQAGWGWALQHWTTSTIQVVNTAVGGRSSRSFRSEGRWDDAMALKPDWVLIQFGHNDQKGKGPERESAADTDYRDHLRRYVKEARKQGAKPILVTPVCRRIYSADGTLRDSLAPYAESVRIVAKELQTPCLDLNRYSFEEFANITDAEALVTYSPEGTTDRTHFSTSASRVVAAWALELLSNEAPELAVKFSPPQSTTTMLSAKQ